MDALTERLANGLIMAKDFLAVPGVVGLKDHGDSRVTVYLACENAPPDDEWAREIIDERKPVTLHVTYARDRRVLR